ncbi:MAG: hypothetical protein A3G87_09535 [Omnitrophica bacterium RIFCSPLOWO2_12_FULL_50_11]|nr:MAG: hypothetical protein A3G87_09535 [Omnitrophica bacterium RIFCSPLOWO2_12_FULL_50_11]
MKITEVRVFQKESDDKKLRAFATVTFDDCFVVRDIKIIEGSRGYFVAMPSRRVKEPCQRCRHRNVVHARYCNQCGAPLESRDQSKEHFEVEQLQSRERQSEHRDIAHPITAEFRETIQKAVLNAYEKEKTKLGEKVS